MRGLAKKFLTDKALILICLSFSLCCLYIDLAHLKGYDPAHLATPIVAGIILIGSIIVATISTYRFLHRTTI